MRACLPIAAALAAFSYVASAAGARPATASPSICDRRDALVAYLASNHGERHVAAEIDGEGLLVELFVADGGSRGLDAPAAMGGSWSILLTRPNGTSYMVAAGQGWEFFRLTPGRDV